jgi:hypothetical protein
MIPYSRIGSKLIKPYNLYIYHGVKEYFFAIFGNDENSFDFLTCLVKWCCERNQGEWPDVLTPKIIEGISKYGKSPIPLEETTFFTGGYFIKDGADYELTHDFVVSVFMSCSDGNFFPLSTGHIDFTGEEKIAAFLRDQISIKEPQAVTFLTKLAIDYSKTQGTLWDRTITIGKLLEIARENDVIADLCIDWGQKANLISIDVENDLVLCNTLILCAYQASPRL